MANTNGNHVSPLNGGEEYYRILANIAFYLMTSNSSFAGTLTFQKEQQLNVVALRGKDDFREQAIKRFEGMITGELCSYLRLEPAVKQLGMSPEELCNFSEKIVQREILEERLDGATYYLKARIFADYEAISTAANLVQEVEEKVRELEQARRRAEEALKEVERLEKEVELAKVKIHIFKKPSHEIEEEDFLSDLFRKGKNHLKNSRLREAIEVFSLLIERYPNELVGYMGRGAAYFKMGQYENAIDDFSKAISLAPETPEAYNNRGSALVMAGRLEESLWDYNKALELYNEYWDALKNRAILKLKYLKDYEAALSDLEILALSLPDDYRTFLLKGIANAKLGNFKEAVTDYDRAIAIKAFDATVYYNKANALLRDEDYDRAIENYNRAIQLRSDIACFYHNRGFAFSKKQMIIDAITDFDRAIELEPQEPTAYIIRGFLYWKLGEKERALEDWERADQLGDSRGTEYARVIGINK